MCYEYQTNEINYPENSDQGQFSKVTTLIAFTENRTQDLLI